MIAKSFRVIITRAGELVSSYLLFEFMVIFQWLLELVLWRLEHEGYYVQLKFKKWIINLAIPI